MELGYNLFWICCDVATIEVTWPISCFLMAPQGSEVTTPMSNLLFCHFFVTSVHSHFLLGDYSTSIVCFLLQQLWDNFLISFKMWLKVVCFQIEIRLSSLLLSRINPRSKCPSVENVSVNKEHHILLLLFKAIYLSHSFLLSHTVSFPKNILSVHCCSCAPWIRWSIIYNTKCLVDELLDCLMFSVRHCYTKL